MSTTESLTMPQLETAEPELVREFLGDLIRGGWGSVVLHAIVNAIEAEALLAIRDSMVQAVESRVERESHVEA